ncbi:hypothetical protein Nepgr_017319 [Nepenthes gracilis]|uniref:Uncharacterized protein n=1 Tax=Nepenthes gracilis TaxID=150966 RepID=A0AAD3XSD3_NEPGR|nr:hypothetical protein Nepgr_017319 [Nepenthes gracilis]
MGVIEGAAAVELIITPLLLGDSVVSVGWRLKPQAEHSSSSSTKPDYCIAGRLDGVGEHSGVESLAIPSGLGVVEGVAAVELVVTLLLPSDSVVPVGLALEAIRLEEPAIEPPCNICLSSSRSKLADFNVNSPPSCLESEFVKMGRWNRRYVPRAKHKQYDYHCLTTRETCRDPESVLWQDNVPLWEKKFCYLVGSISWEKILGARKFMHRHSNILSWDDSAGEEAFHNAKEHFRVSMNGLPSNIEHPDPDLYIDDIDWNPDIDPELVLDLEKEYFAPDENEYDGRVEGIISSACVLEEQAVKQDDVCNPWEHATSGASRDKVAGWNQWNDCVEVTRKWTSEGMWNTCVEATRKLTNENSTWGYRYKQDHGAVKDKQWGDASGKGCEWKPQKYSNISRVSNLGVSSWKHGRADSEYVKRRGSQYSSASSCGLIDGEAWASKSIYLNCSNPPEYNIVRIKGSLHDRNNLWGQKRWGKFDMCENDSKKATTCDGEIHGGFRKREGSNQYGAVYKGPRLQGVDYQTTQNWRNVSNKKRGALLRCIWSVSSFLSNS